MFDDSKGFLSRSYLRRMWALEYKAWCGSPEEEALLARLRAWASRGDLKERSAEAPFVQQFFVETWGYAQAGTSTNPGHTAEVGWAVPTAGAGGSTGEADLAMGWLGEGGVAIPQVLCEFKDMRTALDLPQARKGNTRSPVRQCFDYLAGARRQLYPNEPVQPWWGVITDMNEFRLYWWNRMPQQYLRFVLKTNQPLLERSLLDDGDESRFDRFAFAKTFHRDRLLSRAGPPSLLRLIESQVGAERKIEGEFYADYKAVRERLYNVLLINNPGYQTDQAQLLRMTQRILDRFIFVFYCEDMGERLMFPPQLVQNELIKVSLDPLFEENGDDLWRRFRRIFAGMDAGARLGQINLRAFNGGLFKPDPEIDALELPNHVFCAAGQGSNRAAIEQHRNTLLHLAASYDYAAGNEARESITLYTLGRIFEQSITWLEIEEARLEGRKSLAEAADRKLPTRKANGVYYTPEWVVERVVEGALGAWFRDQRATAGWLGDQPETLAQIEVYETRIADVRVVDPACGSGAFLIGAYRRLLQERLEVHGLRQALTAGTSQPADEKAISAAILDGNLFGVDLSASAVEIAKLALWLHSARADAPLSSLEAAVKRGNSLVGPMFEAGRASPLSDARRDEVAPFDWAAAFPFGGVDPGRFDVVVGNPPYVKLQNLKAVDREVADWLSSAAAGYRSTRTGNFDLYLPFIEKGLDMLRPGGRMGYIAPNVWAVAEYGKALRALVAERRSLVGWVDFKSHQIFRDVTVYTSLQFFARAGGDVVQVVPAPKGEADAAAARSTELPGLPWTSLPGDAPWVLATGEERRLIDRLKADCLRLDDPSLTGRRGIIVGIQTSADEIYHLCRLGSGRYRCTPSKSEPYEVEIEDAIMRPLVSGAEAKRYEEPQTDTWLLFPYEKTAAGVGLIPQATMETRFRKAWAYLRSWEQDLRGREVKKNGEQTIRPFDDDQWYRFGRNQNLDKQELKKLIVAQTVPSMRVCADNAADKYLNNVRVNGILAPNEIDLGFLMGVLNGPVAGYVFKRIAKAKDGGWFEANKQFIGPLPVPKASPEVRAALGERAMRMQTLTTERRDLIAASLERLAAAPGRERSLQWLWPDLPHLADLREQAQGRLSSLIDVEKRAEQLLAERVAERHAALQARLDSGLRLAADYADGALRLTADGAAVLPPVFLDEAEGVVTQAWWRWLLLTTTPKAADSFAKALRSPPADPTTAAARQFVERVEALSVATREIEAVEAALNEQLFTLYGLDEDERLLVQKG